MNVPTNTNIHYPDLYQGGGNMTHKGSYPAGLGIPYPSDTPTNLIPTAAAHAAALSSSFPSFFSNAISSIVAFRERILNPSSSAQGEDEIDEQACVADHAFYFPSSTPSPSSHPPPAGQQQRGEDGDVEKRMANAAAMEALRLFIQGNGPDGGKDQSLSAFLGLAMATAVGLFAEEDDGTGGWISKREVVRRAAEVAVLLYLRSQG
ncbi:hypothetical protein QBC47DRAFT_60277 [Echria macrotheca]|uniref:DUF7721 domain-containing protein n=1 Tax=Echria macrotheca TaxID=438768 RepID=A0AAJ0B6D9_9PEZI|nr:hypothetical protein QBC47DRAFT_60277 [Echria macrotheca]